MKIGKAILLAGLIAAILDGTDAVVFYFFAFGVSPVLLFENIAAGVLGRVSFQYGWRTMLLGIALHFVIATGAATAYILVSTGWRFLAKQPLIYGPLFGIAVYLVMHYIVVPASRVPVRTAPVTTAELADQLFSHMFFVGLPIALMARRAAQATAAGATA